jgi:hypothetical protein
VLAVFSRRVLDRTDGPHLPVLPVRAQALTN